MRGPMNFKLKAAAAAMLAASLVASFAYASDPAPTAKKHVATKKASTPPPPTVAQQIQALREEMQSQIDSLKTNLADKDAQLKKAQQAATDAQAAADKAQAAASAQNQAVSDNAAAVNTLQSTVTDMKSANASAVASLSDETAAVKKAIANPTTLHYKGITLTPGGFAAAETVYRSKATGGDIPTAFTSIPYEGSDLYRLSEFFGSARQSRVSLMAEGKTNWGTLRGYYEADWLGTGITSNNNQSNSYVMRQRVIWAQAETNSHLAFTGGQLWSLATEDKKGISNLSGDIMTPQTIDPNYVVGFVWTRQYGFRVTKTFPKMAFGFAAENPQLLYKASLAGNEPYAVLGSAGTNGGNYNAAISTCTPATSIVNYTNQVQVCPRNHLPRRNHQQQPLRRLDGHRHRHGNCSCPDYIWFFQQQHQARRLWRQLARSRYSQQAHLWLQGPVWTWHGPLRRQHTLRRYRQCGWRASPHPQCVWPYHDRSHADASTFPIPQLRRRLCWPRRLWRCRHDHFAGRAQR